MSDYSKLKRLAEASVGEWYGIGELRYEDRRSGDIHGLHHDDERFIAAANPAAVLELIAERDAYRAALEGAVYRMLDNMVERGPEFARSIGSAAATLTMGIQQERDRLKAENERLKTGIEHSNDLKHRFSEPLEEAEHQNAALRKDAERYRWFRDCATQWAEVIKTDAIGWILCDELDDAIDAAMEQEQQP